MAPHADEITPGVTNAAHGEKIPETSKFLKNGIKSSNDFSYPPYVQSNYRILQQYHSKPTKLRVACVGAGASGLCLAYKMEKNLVPGSWDLTLFEKNPHFGGTWYENTYPGVACDVSPPYRSSTPHGVCPFPSPQHLIHSGYRFLRISTPSAGIQSPIGPTTLPTETRSRNTLKTLPSDTVRRSI
jgi:hypothetical protein